MGGVEEGVWGEEGGGGGMEGRREGEALESEEADGQLTYELMNRDSGERLRAVGF